MSFPLFFSMLGYYSTWNLKGLLVEKNPDCVVYFSIAHWAKMLKKVPIKRRNWARIWFGIKSTIYHFQCTVYIVVYYCESLRPPPRRGLRDHHNPRTLKEKKKGHVILSDKSRHSRPAAAKDRKIYLCYIHGSAFGGTRHHPWTTPLKNLLVSKFWI